MGSFEVDVRYFRKAPLRFGLRDAWAILDSDLSPNGRETYELISSPDSDVSKIHHAAAWASQAVLELQDLQLIPFPREGRFFNLNYLFCEGLTVLREAVLCGLNGQVHASLTALRSAYELFVFHYWWKRRLFGAHSYDEFYGWLHEGKSGGTFSSSLRDLYADVHLPPAPARAVQEWEARDVYAGLCSYAHKPRLEEAINTIRNGNQRRDSHVLGFFWLSYLYSVQRIVLEIAIAQTPHALFPLDLHRKFGFNPPVGVFFDHANHLPLQQVLDEELVAYQEYYRDRDLPREQLEWFEALPELSEDQIWATRDRENDPDDESKPFEERAFIRYCCMKANMRTIMWAQSYGRETPSISDLGLLMRAGARSE